MKINNLNTRYDKQKPFFVLAPMDDVTDVVFRQIVDDSAPADMYMTEFVNVDGLQSVGRPKLLHKLYKRPTENNLIVQLWGKNPDNYFKTAKEMVDMGFAGIDINMGCPDKAVVKNGCCSALINDRVLAGQIIDATKDGASGAIPISVKTRIGYDAVDLSWIEFLLEQNLDMLTIHGRTKKQMSKVSADWEIIGKARDIRDATSPQTLIVGNGDVLTKKQGLELAKRYELDGIMIGRGVFSDPYVFSSNSPWPTMDPGKKIALFRKQVELFVENYKNNERNYCTLKRFAKIYINGFENASELRQRVMDSQSAESMLGLL